MDMGNVCFGSEAVLSSRKPARPQLSDKLPIREWLASLELNQIHNPSLRLYVGLYVALGCAQIRMSSQHLHVPERAAHG
jgi:hypothetical protein